MFTGLIESIGVLNSVDRRGENLLFRVTPNPAFTDLRLGDSVALDGYCQTVVSVTQQTFDVEVSPETAAVTTAAAKRTGDRINLERAMRLSDRLGGHLVTGHVESVGEINRIERGEQYVVLGITVRPETLRYCVPKGSIAVDGVSLTINAVRQDGIEVGIIPHTWNHTTLAEKQVGGKVNLESDIIAKYVERFVAARFGEQQGNNNIDEEFLAKHGFFE